MTNKQTKPLVLLNIEGWGIFQKYDGNAILNAKTPNFKSLFSTYPATTLSTANSANPIYNTITNYQALGQNNNEHTINQPITLLKSDIINDLCIKKTINHAAKNKSSIHLFSSINSKHENSITSNIVLFIEILKQKNIKKIFLHIFLNNKNNFKKEGFELIKNLEKIIKNKIKLCSVIGGFYALDTKNYYIRTEKTYKALIENSGNLTNSIIDSILKNYNSSINDNEITPIIASKENIPIGQIKKNDCLLFINNNLYELRQLLHSIYSKKFNKFKKKSTDKNLHLNIFTSKGHIVNNDFFTQKNNKQLSLNSLISENNKNQLIITDSKSLAFMEYFLGANSENNKNTSTILIPNSTTLNQKNNIIKITKELINQINTNKYHLIITTYNLIDTAAHTGNINKTIKAIEKIDEQIGIIYNQTIKKNGTLLITSAFGNAEYMYNPLIETIETEHTDHSVPFLIINKKYEGKNINQFELNEEDLSLLRTTGSLNDVAHTILKLLDIKTNDTFLKNHYSRAL